MQRLLFWLPSAVPRKVSAMLRGGFAPASPPGRCRQPSVHVWRTLLGVLLLSPVFAWSSTTTLVVHENAIVQGPQITIADVAAIQGGSTSLHDQIGGIVIGQSPPAGQERLLYGAYIVTRLKQQGVTPESFEIKVPSKIRVRRASQRIEPRDIETAVIRAIRAKMSWPSHQVTMRSFRGIEAVLLPRGPVGFEVTFPVNTDYVGPTSFTVSFRVAGNLEKRLFGSVTIEVMQEVVTTARPIDRHELVKADDLRMTRMNVARLPRRILLHPDEVIGKRSKRALQAHALIHAYDVETLPMIRKGDVVVILAESPLLKVSTVGEALESGQRNETIRVRNVSSQREIRAVVVDGKTVRVPF